MFVPGSPIGSALRCTLLYSSLAAILGNVGQAVYAAVNSQVNALAQGWRRFGWPTTALAWGNWADVGLATDVNDALSESGFPPWA